MATGVAMAAPVIPARPAAPALYTNQTVLRYREVPFVVDRWRIPVSPESQTAFFTNLPAPGRAALTLASMDVSGHPIGMAWDRKAGRVWLDLNGNRDLTDDPEGFFETTDRGAAQTFTNAHLTALTRRGPAKVCLDLALEWREGTCLASGRARCCLAGKLELGGQVWQVAYVSEFFDFKSPVQEGAFMARPWDPSLEGRAWPATMAVGMPGFAFSGPNADGVRWRQASTVLFGGNAWSVEGRETETNGPPAMILEVRGEARERGVIELTGSNVTRVLLGQGNRWGWAPVVANRFEIAEGRYSIGGMGINSGGVMVYAARSTSRYLDVKKGVTNRFVAGMPLTNRVEASREGHSIRVACQTLDAGGLVNLVSSMGGQNQPRPEFSIWKGGRRVAAGPLEYG